MPPLDAVRESAAIFLQLCTRQDFARITKGGKEFFYVAELIPRSGSPVVLSGAVNLDQLVSV